MVARISASPRLASACQYGERARVVHILGQIDIEDDFYRGLSRRNFRSREGNQSAKP